jgi:excisionase family DNA binding protein
MPKKLRIGEAAQRVGLSTHTLRRYVVSKDVSAHRTPGGHLRFLESDLDRFIKESDGKWDK